ncbi:FecR family protein [Maribellus sp. CM-23]|uniref:FecR family protein n=1 Tax=Maribellus sp. CM-23 TaxID=2781026 RepID=UPI001F1D4872|nr:FecR family protein [Maribellus sp. CM-23]MCE4565746.1 FecR family protein [Maribellus sp. CM-23]
MKSKSENKLDDLVSFFHEGEREDLQEEDYYGKEFKSVEKIYSLREKVTLLAKLKPAESAWAETEDRMIEKKQNLIVQKFLRFPYVAALFILALLGGALGVVTYLSPTSDEQVLLTEIVSGTGEMKQVELPDGTNAWLGSNSILKYNNKFGERNRFVKLDGEAMFDVTSNDKLPFLVNIQKASIKVHGTKFVVTSYAQGNKNDVVLLEGKVEYLRQEHSSFMIPGESLSDNLLTDKITQKKVELDSYNQWKEGKVFLDNNSLGYLVFLMEQWYGEKFVFNSKNLKELTFTGVINKNKPLDYNLNIIELTNKVKFEKNENEISIIEQN